VGKYLIPLLPIETEEQVYAIYEVHSPQSVRHTRQRRAG
jgi:hypothetical protein